MRISQSGDRPIKTACAALILSISAYTCFIYVDGAEWIRDARAVADTYSWFRAHPQLVQRLLWSQAYMCILFDRDPWEKPVFSDEHESNLQLLRASPDGTLVFWDVDALREKLVRVYRASDPDQPTIYRKGEIAEAEPALPNWKLPVDTFIP